MYKCAGGNINKKDNYHIFFRKLRKFLQLLLIYVCRRCFRWKNIRALSLIIYLSFSLDHSLLAAPVAAQLLRSFCIFLGSALLLLFWLQLHLLLLLPLSFAKATKANPLTDLERIFSRLETSFFISCVLTQTQMYM